MMILWRTARFDYVYLQNKQFQMETDQGGISVSSADMILFTEQWTEFPLAILTKKFPWDQKVVDCCLGTLWDLFFKNLH